MFVVLLLLTASKFSLLNYFIIGNNLDVMRTPCSNKLAC